MRSTRNQCIDSNRPLMDIALPDCSVSLGYHLFMIQETEMQWLNGSVFMLPRVS